MSTRPARRRRPLPLREGVDPVRVRLADPGQGPRSIIEELRRRFPDRVAELDAALAAGEVVDADGAPITPETRRHRGMDVWMYRTPEPEIPVPFEIAVIDRDDRILVVDKPHFLATTPRAGHVRQTALVRLRRDTGLEDLAPCHRLDRLTAGVLVFTLEPRHRGAYQSLFAARHVHKTYLAAAPVRSDFPQCAERYSRIVKTRGVLQAAEVDGEPDAHTRIELLDRIPAAEVSPAVTRTWGQIPDGCDLGLFRLRPSTGRTHQLRVHLAALGSPLLGDDLYPHIRSVRPGDFSAPLQLLAESLSFTDPIDGAIREFRTRRQLAAWPGTPLIP